MAPNRTNSVCYALAAAATCNSLALAYFQCYCASDNPIALEKNELSTIPCINATFFDLASPNDFVDGFPLDEAVFWTRTRRRKLLLCAILSTQMAISFLVGVRNPLEFAEVAFTSYLLLIGVIYIRIGDFKTHALLNASLASLTTIICFILGLNHIIPSTEATSTLQISNIVLYFLAASIATTIPRGPLQYFPPEDIYPATVPTCAPRSSKNNVHGAVDASPLSALFFSYITRITSLNSGFSVADLPLLTASMRATVNFTHIRSALLGFKRWNLPLGLRFGLVTLKTNVKSLLYVAVLSGTIALLRYVPAYSIRFLLQLLEKRQTTPLTHGEQRWGLVYIAAQFVSALAFGFGWGQLWNRAHITDIQMVAQINTLLFVKTLARKTIVSTSPDTPIKSNPQSFTHKAEIVTMMSQDVHRVSAVSMHIYTLTDATIQLVLGTCLLYSLLGVSALVGLAAALLSVPLQQYIGQIVIQTQSSLMKTKDQRIALTSEILAGIRMIKFMAWERNFEAKLWSIREKELEMQKITYLMKMLLTTVGNLIPLLFALASFGHYTVLRHQSLTPSIVFTSVIVFNGIQYAISGLPEAILAAVQCFVSLCRIDQYLDSQEVSLDRNISKHISLCDATITWPGVAHDDSAFKLSNVTVEFPMGELSLICGRVGSGKSLLLLGLLGEADVIDGHVICPHSSPDFIAKSLQKHIAADEWIVSGSCAYVPQTAWLRNQSIRENILFGLPHSVERYMKTLEACALIPDLDIFEYGDLTEIGERGITLSTGQKARISLARAVYSRASILLLDDVLSAVDVHTAHKIYHGCLKGELMHQRTVLLVSHHLQLCVDRSAHVVALEDGKVVFQGPPSAFHRSNTFHGLINSQQQHSEVTEVAKSAQAEVLQPLTTRGPIKLRVGDAPKLVIDEVSSVGRINWDVWKNFLGAYGRTFFWVSFTIGLIVAGLGPVIENSYLRVWADAGEAARPLRYVSIYAGILSLNLTLRVIHSYILYRGSIRSSRVLYQRLLENVLFSSVRYHDTVARGSLLNRFAKDMQIIDGFIADDFGRAMKLGLSTLITFITLAVVGGVLFAVSALILAVIFGVASQDYGHTSRDMRRLVSTTFSPLYSVYDTAITGAIVIRSFGASTAFLRDMMRFVDANSSACHWQWGLNRWFSVLSIAFGGSIVAAVGLAVLLSSTNDASLAGLALVFASTISVELMYFIRAFVGLEQSLVAVERVKATSDLPRDPPEIIDPRPPIGWPTAGMIQCENFSIRYAPDLPNVLHNITFRVEPGQKIGIVGRTGSGKSTLALSFFRFVEASTGRLVIDGLDIATLGLTDLRSGLTIIPQDPTLMSGTLRSNLDTFDEHQDTDIFEALRSVHLLSDNDSSVFANLDSPVSQGGNNFSAGQKQLLCMARALLKHSKVLLIDEATASLDYATDERVGLTIREKFSQSTILTIAHRLRSIIDYDKVMVLQDGRMVEFDNPAVLLKQQDSIFSEMCQATGREEFATLRRMARL